MAHPLAGFSEGGDYEAELVDRLNPYVRNEHRQGVWRCPSDRTPRYGGLNGTEQYRMCYNVNDWFQCGLPAGRETDPARTV